MGYQAIDPYLLSAYKKTLDKYIEKRTASALAKYRRGNRKTYRYRGTTFVTESERDTDGWYSAWERQVARNRRRRKRATR